MAPSPEVRQNPSWSDQSPASQHPLAACPKRRRDVKSRLVDGETVVLDQQAGVIHQLNPTASFIWERCDGQSTLTDIAQQLAHAFEVDPQVASCDVNAMIRQLEALHLLELCTGEDGGPEKAPVPESRAR
jgi:Coenzyme PQQ synthesis protein D (PqqD)